jgi:hypothetical protein
MPLSCRVDDKMRLSKDKRAGKVSGTVLDLAKGSRRLGCGGHAGIREPLVSAFAFLPPRS